MSDFPLKSVFNAPSEREKWDADHAFRKSELELKRTELDVKKRELDLREAESARAKTLNPLVLAIAGGALTLFVQTVATFVTGYQQRQTEAARNKTEEARERQKAESQLVLEVIDRRSHKGRGKLSFSHEHLPN